MGEFLRTVNYPKLDPTNVLVSRDETNSRTNHSQLVNSSSVQERIARRRGFTYTSDQIATSAKAAKLPITIFRGGSVTYARPDDYVRDVDLFIVLPDLAKQVCSVSQLNDTLGIHDPNFVASPQETCDLFEKADVLRYKYINMNGVPLDISVSTETKTRNFLSPLRYRDQVNLSVYCSVNLPDRFDRKLFGLTGDLAFTSVEVEAGGFTREPGVHYIAPPVDTYTLPPGYDSFLLADVLYDGSPTKFGAIQDSLLKMLLRYGVFRYNMKEIAENGMLKEGAEETLFRLFFQKERFSPDFKAKLKEKFCTEFEIYQHIKSS